MIQTIPSFEIKAMRKTTTGIHWTNKQKAARQSLPEHKRPKSILFSPTRSPQPKSHYYREKQWFKIRHGRPHVKPSNPQKAAQIRPGINGKNEGTSQRIPQHQEKGRTGKLNSRLFDNDL
jgi:hypothetical protein